MRSIRSIASIAAIAAASVAALIVPVSSARAQGVTFSGTLTLAAPTFNRPLTGIPPTALSGVGTAVHYNVQQFFVSTNGGYDFLSTTAPLYDNFTVIYSSSFNPASPLLNAIGANDDFPTIGLSGFTSLTLTANTQYFFVTTGFGNTDVGSYVNTIGTVTRPAGSVVTLGTVGGAAAPEPGTLSLLGMGLAGGAGTLGVVRRRRKAA